MMQSIDIAKPYLDACPIALHLSCHSRRAPRAPRAPQLLVALRQAQPLQASDFGLRVACNRRLSDTGEQMSSAKHST